MITNVEIDDLAWVQASLPVAHGGLGVRSAALLAPSAFLASAAATLGLQTQLLPHGVAFPDKGRGLALSTWTGRHGGQIPEVGTQTKQKTWDKASVAKSQDHLLATHTDQYNRARLLAS